MVQVSKTQTAHTLLAKGEVKEALRIFKGFRLGLTKEQSDAIKLGYECTIYPEFYRQLKVDVEAAIAKAVSVCNQLRSA